MILKSGKKAESRMDLGLRKMVFQGPELGRRTVTRNGRRPVLLKPEHKRKMLAKCPVSCLYRVGAKTSYWYRN